jgi:sugar/nucleoside kinase (ribokinase family)
VLSKKCGVSDEEYKKIDLLCMSEDDIKGQPELLEKVVKLVPVVALTHGATGYDLYRNGIKNSYGVFRTFEVDPTGAGDVFASGLVHSLATGKSDTESGYIGAGLASVIVEEVGGKALYRITEGISRAKFIDTDNSKIDDFIVQPDIHYSEIIK